VGNTNQNVNLSSNVTVNGRVTFVNNINLINGGTLTVPDDTTLEPRSNAVTNAIIQVGNNGGGGAVNQTGGTVKLKRTDGTTGNPKTAMHLGSSGNATGVYNLSGGSLMDISAAGTTTVVLGDSSGATGILNVTGTGLVQVVGLRLGNASGASGIINLTNGNIITTGGTFDVGRSSSGGDGTINVYGGTLTVAGTSMNVPHGIGNGTVSLFGGNINVGTSLNVPETSSGNGTVNINGGTFTVTNNLNLPNGGTGSGMVNLNGGTLVVSLVAHSGANSGVLNLNGGVLKPRVASTAFIANNVTVNIGADGAIIDTPVDIAIPAPLLSGAGGAGNPEDPVDTDGGLTKLGDGTLTLTGTNTYTGPTIVSNGTLAVNNPGALFASVNIVVGLGATLNVSGVGTLPVNTAPTLNGTLVLRIAKSGVTLGNDKLSLGGDTFYYGGTLTVTATGNTLAAGDTFQLFNATSFSGSFAALNLPSLPAGLVWDVSRLGVDGTIRVPGTNGPLMFTSIVLNNGNAIIRGSGGAVNVAYNVLSSTNVTLPLTNWTPIATNRLFDVNGNFSFTNAMNPTVPARFFALFLPPPPPPPPPPDTAEGMVIQALQNMRDEGFNTHLPVPGGLYINWVYTSTPPPTKVNVQSNGNPDPDPTTRHDRLTDLEYLSALSLYKQRFPADTQFDSEITKYTTICLSDGFLTSPDQRGWTYFTIQDIALTVPSATNWADAQADNLYKLYTNNLAKYGGVIPLYTKFNTNSPAEAAGYYRVDGELENASVLIINGKKRGLTTYVTAGENLFAFLKSNAWSTKLNIFPKEMGFVFTDSTKTTINNGNEVIFDGVIKPGEIGEVTWAMCYAEEADPGHGYGAWAKTMIDNMQPSVNGYGFWDSTHGGYWSQNRFINSTDIHSSSLALSLSTSYKEVGRFTVVLRAFLAANATGVANYSSNTLATIQAANLASYYTNGHGWTYQANGDFSRYQGNDWVTSEAIGHACCSILAYGLAGLP
jgi:autotransporter-associated beta strand protein